MKYLLAAALFALLFLIPASTLAQPTLNIAPRISWQGIATSQRAFTACLSAPSGQTNALSSIAVSDGDVATGIMEARIDLEPGLVGGSTIDIPGLAAIAGVTIIRQQPDRLRFTAPLSSVNQALTQLRYLSTAAQIDVLDIVVDDLQLPPLSTEMRAYFNVAAGALIVGNVCLPPPDLRPQSDTGVDDDDLTEDVHPQFRITGLSAGDVVVLLNDELPIAQGTATGPELILTDPAAAMGLTHLYSVSVNGNLGSAAWSVAVLAAMFADGFETP
jgi:hypothetical protein